MARVFVAVWPPPTVVATLAALPRDDVPGLRRVPASALHVTLRFLGDVAVATVAERLHAATLPAATATLGPTTEMLGRRVVVAPVAGLDALAATVTRATEDLGRPARHPFRGHVTLARVRDEDVGRRVAGVAVSGRFDVARVAIVTSDTRPDGARYDTAATVSCRPVRPHR